ncbi:MAG: PrsW family intramembrane metalloprotease [Dehalococcoidia bacterium]|nr:PrsW family intramembrane metalloprotease [Dehalococcoidia bacterium]MBL7165068.1 PrsW family intramembrane metalloprotease [Dehalococcoidales bacterium]
MQFIVILVIAFAPGVFWLWMVYRRDRYRPEPRALVVRTFIWGMVVSIPVALLEFGLIFIVDPDVINFPEVGQLSLGTAAYISFVVAGVTEELGKYLVVRRTVYRSPYFDEPMDGLVYASASALGFASLENLGYLLTYGWEVILMRGPFSTLAHVLFSAMWGYPLGVSKVRQRGMRAGTLLGLLCSMAAHGLFNFLIFTQSAYSLLVIPLFLGAGAVFFFMMRRATRLSPFREMVGQLLVVCPNCGDKVPCYAGFCMTCGAEMAEAGQDGPAFCGKCGATLNCEAAFCTSCGSRILRNQSK